MRLQFPLYKLFLVFVVYALALGAFCPLGMLGAIIAIVTGTAGGALVLLIRSRKDVVSALIVAIGSMVEAGLPFYAVTPTAPPRITDTEYVLYWFTLSIGAAVGGLFFSWSVNR